MRRKIKYKSTKNPNPILLIRSVLSSSLLSFRLLSMNESMPGPGSSRPYENRRRGKEVYEWQKAGLESAVRFLWR